VLHEVSREAVDFVERESTVKTYSFLRPYYLLLGFNVRHPAFKEPAVRRALNLAVDRDAIVRLAMQGRGEPAHGPIWPHHWAYTSASRAYSFNPEAAKLLLDNAGYRLPVSRKPGQMPSRLRFKCLLLADDPRFEQAALVVQKQLYDIGVDMDIQPMGGLEMVERFASGDFDAFLIEQTSGRSLAWVYRFWHSPSPGAPPLNNSGYTSADSVLDRLRAASTDEDTRAAVNDLQRVLYDDPPAVFLAWGQVSRAVRIEFQVPKNSNPDIIGSLWHWRREPQVITAGQ
jgi:peptide/nickel transport system substrate-binding protein